MHDEGLSELLSNSRAVGAFKHAVLKFSSGDDSDFIRYSRGSPRIKVLRVLMKLLEAYPTEEIAGVQIDALSTCSTFQGIMILGPTGKRISFNWDCRWKAAEAGFVTWYGVPDQSKAAELFGFQCFREFQEVVV
ncbi:MAG TPA: hypothetical protein VGA99_11460 [bacterium]